MIITREMFDKILPMAKEYIKRLKLFWDKENSYRKYKLRDAADVLTAAYIIWGGDEYRAQDKALAIAIFMEKGQWDYDKTTAILRRDGICC